MPTEVYINATSHYFPEKSVDNQEIIDDYLPYVKAGEVPLTAEDLKAQCWVETRYQCGPSETAKDLGNNAAKKLFAEWNIDKQDIDYIIFVSDALEYKGPTTAIIMQKDLGLNQSVGAIDILHGCSGFVYGLSIAKALILSGQISNALLITADMPTTVTHPADADLRAIFSDAGAATFLSNRTIENGMNATVGDFIFGSDGTGEQALKVERSGTRNPANIDWLSQYKDVDHGNKFGRLKMDSAKIFLFASRKVPTLVQAVLEKENLSKDDMDLYVFHQANGQMLNFLRKRLKIPEEKFVINIQNIGNTVSASIPIALYQSFKQGKIKNHDKVLLAGFGIGFSWGGTILKF